MNKNIIPPTTLPLKADRDLAAIFGVAAKDILHLRLEKLTEGEHWQKRSGKNSIAFTDEGRKVIEIILNLVPDEPPPKPVVEPSKVVLLKLIRPCLNPLFATVRTPEGLSENIRVRNSKRLRPNMLLQCSLINGKWACVQNGMKPL